tara:strand:- start:1118 stop:1681 length:564 start_codon:yes stop_codon:yes gene_type:complete
MAYFYTQHIKTADTKAEITVDYNDYKSLTLVNKHASASVTVDLYLVDQTGSALRQSANYENSTPTKVNLSAGYAITSSSQAIVVDTASATDDIFLNEKVWLSTGTLIGTCTAVGSTTGITFGDGIVYPLANNDDLYTGARFHILNNVVIPNGTSLRLDGEDFNFHNDNYKLYINMNQADGLDIMLRR